MSPDGPTALRPYAGGADLPGILAAVGEWNRRADGCGYLHPGDIGHFMSNGLRDADPTPHLHLAEDDGGALRALVLLYPARSAGYDLLVHPDRRGGPLEERLLAWAAEQEEALLGAAGSPATTIGIDVMDCDTVRRDLLLRAGYAPTDAPGSWYTTRSLEEPLPAAPLPAGFSIRAARGVAEAAALGAVHAGAFGSSWPGDAYRAVIESPGYRGGEELVVEAPGGRLAAFLVWWPDPVSRRGLFEPVGCHADFQRRGLTKDLLTEGLRRMQAAGMDGAVVKHLAGDPAATAAYASVGFRPRYTIAAYHKVR